MKRTLLLLPATFVATLLFAQASETEAINKTVGQGKTLQKQTEVLNNRNKNEDKTDILDITGIGGAVFSNMNYPDISANSSNNFSLKITLALLTGANKAPGYQLVFSPETEKKAYVVETQNGVTSVYFPIGTFEVINQKLESAITLKKKIQLKITQNPNGYREAVLAL